MADGMTRILVRADGSAAIGSGHVMRCLTLAEALPGPVTFACVEMTDALAARVAAAGHRLERLPGPRGGAADLAALQELAAAADWLVVDGYAFDAAYRRGLCAAGRPVLALDDTAEVELFADVVVNMSPAAAALPYGRVAPGARLLLGPAYALVRRDVMACRPLPSGSAGTLLVSFGGSDPLGLTLPVTAALRNAMPEVPLHVVLGGSVPDAAKIADKLRALGAAADVDVGDMGTLLRGCRLAVSAAGSTMYELAALGCPALLVVVAENQDMAARQAAAEGWMACMDGRTGDATAGIAERASALWHNDDALAALAAKAVQAVDGQGAERIAQWLVV